MCFFIHAGPAFSDSVSVAPPRYAWMSPRLPFAVRSLDYGSPRKPGVKEWVLLTRDHLFVYEKRENRENREQALNETAMYRSPFKKEEFIRLYLKDLDHDGRDEILVTSVHHGKLRSFILAWQESGGWKRLLDRAKYAFAVTSLEKEFIGQKKDGPLYTLDYANGRLTATQLGGLPHLLNLFQTQWIDLGDGFSHLLSMTSSGNVILYDLHGEKYSRRWISGKQYGGATADSVATGNLQVISVFPPQVVVFKNEDYLKGIVGKPIIKWSELYRLEWTGMGFREIWQSEELDGAIVDLKLANVDDDSPEEIILVLQLRDGPQTGSVLLMYDLYTQRHNSP